MTDEITQCSLKVNFKIIFHSNLRDALYIYKLYNNQLKYINFHSLKHYTKYVQKYLVYV